MLRLTTRMHLIHLRSHSLSFPIASLPSARDPNEFRKHTQHGKLLIINIDVSSKLTFVTAVENSTQLGVIYTAGNQQSDTLVNTPHLWKK
ncbi:hypothetical protein GBL98_12435 [Yersinia pseudotuberculosis]|uniref:Uncharacterized protein n=2 Tax=Yersinia pseudotuberculosis TaxID=633 RepID=Q664G9_YERPS|nr:hypothetical protein EGX87_03055 [Yersinia pseudotuberculosis]CAH23038.1 hypothetical protein YPTB3800 [Yersinia pseudotuberculosis IP 32953]AYW91393.1 hypothetical protein EGX47_08710 [Yersinia pseudotuberculosis]AYW95483.1 hypothetical protein EGX39_06235 [Yersinia pseudotuberculosis]AYX00923.1 hypothetical protein EGX53_14255 [Yersinia pseudotuberculosis]